MALSLLVAPSRFAVIRENRGGSITLNALDVAIDLHETLTAAANSNLQGSSVLQADSTTLPLLANFVELSDILGSIDFAKYWFMLPACILIAFCANSSGIGGAALFGPIFLIIFPALGPQYPLSSPAAAVGIAILVESFGFSSGVTGYVRRGLIDFKTAAKLAAASMPVALIASKYLALPELLLKATYSLLMLTLGTYLLRQSALSESDTKMNDEVEGELFASFSEEQSSSVTTDMLDKSTSMTLIKDSTGKVYNFRTPDVDVPTSVTTALGGILCGLLGVGIGEVVLPQLLRKGVPVAVAAATSTLVVALTCLACAEVQVSALVEAGGLSAIPWSLVVYMIPGVVIGAQIATLLQGKLSKAQLEKAIGSLFTFIGVVFTFLTLKQSGVISI